MANPYETLPPDAFWRTGVANLSPFSISQLWKPKYKIGKQQKIVTAGSCFAQHIGRALVRNGYHWLDAEPAPTIANDSLKLEFNYGVFSFRTGNIYTTALFRQWIMWALGKEDEPDEAWEMGGRWFDPFRPNIEPQGFGSYEEMRNSRLATLSAIRKAIEESSVFIFTLGLTEGWVNERQSYSYPMCPGTVAGEFDAELHRFVNFSFDEIRKDLWAAISAARSVNPKLRFLLTVSPVPLTATATNEHVLTATTLSKSTLRAVAGHVAGRSKKIDYFPSYELITAPCFRGVFFEPNMRSVHPDGVAFVMRNFFADLEGTKPPTDSVPSNPWTDPQSDADDDIVCEEIMLDAFSTG